MASMLIACSHDAVSRLVPCTLSTRLLKKDSQIGQVRSPWLGYPPGASAFQPRRKLSSGLPLSYPRSQPVFAVLRSEVGPNGSTESRTEAFITAIEDSAGVDVGARLQELRQQADKVEADLASIQVEIDSLVNATFANVKYCLEMTGANGPKGTTEAGPLAMDDICNPETLEESPVTDEDSWTSFSRDEPLKMKALIAAVEREGDQWQRFQSCMQELSLRRNRMRQHLKALKVQIVENKRVLASLKEQGEMAEEDESAEVSGAAAGGAAAARPAGKPCSIVLVAGFETFNLSLYKKVAKGLAVACPGLKLSVFSERDITARPADMEAALASADVFFASLVFDFDQCEWLIQRVQNIPIRLVFESSLELMALTRIGSFAMGGAKPKGMPPAVKAVLSKFGSGREEDKLTGYLSFLKIGPKLLRFIPGQKARDLRNWLTVYGYWNQGGYDNVLSMFLYLANEYVTETAVKPATVTETPAQGLYHPDLDGYITDTQQFLKWSKATRKDLPQDAPVVGLLLYRKHVITNQKYIPQLIRQMEKDGLRPLPYFINGVEAHTIVRDTFTSAYEQERRRNGVLDISSLSKNAVPVDIIVNTVGFPLVGGPAGSQEGARQQEVGQAILRAKNVPYIVSAPLLIQDITSWRRDGIQGLQSVVLYSLPELDGAIDGVPLGGLVGDGIHLVPERARRLTARINKWVRLARKPAHDRKLAVMLYGFPPGVGATGTAALLNVPRSLEAVLRRLHQEGYDLGLPKMGTVQGGVASQAAGQEGSSSATPGDMFEGLGDAIIQQLVQLDDSRVVNAGAMGPTLAAQIFGGGAEKSHHTVAGPHGGAGHHAVPGHHGTMAGPVVRGGSNAQARPSSASSAGSPVHASGPHAGAGGAAHAEAKGSSASCAADDSSSGAPRLLHAHAHDVSQTTLRKWLGAILTIKLERSWGKLDRYRGIKSSAEGNSVISGVQLGNVFIGVQPLLGVEGDPMRLLFQRDLTPHPQYAAFYKWLQEDYDADAVLHFGMHGTVEWLPGSPLGNTGYSWSDVLMGDMPNIYVYAANNPSESIVAKRRGYGTIVSHNVPPYGRAGLYKELANLKDVINEYREKPEANEVLREVIVTNLSKAGLQDDVPFIPAVDGGQEAAGAAAGVPAPLTAENVGSVDGAVFQHYVGRVYEYLSVLENRLFSEGLHVLGSPPTPTQMAQYLSAYFGDDLSPAAIEAICATPSADLAKTRNYLETLLARSPTLLKEGGSGTAAAGAAKEGAGGSSGADRGDKVGLAVTIKELLSQNTEEISSIARALNGEFVPAAAGGDLLRDGPGVLPTGRNIHALDPYRMPSAAAWERGSKVGAALVQQHLDEAGAYPETVAVMLWGLDAIKTRGESVAIALHLVGARPVKESTGRIARFELIPLSELGRPRIDVLANLSGIFRDSFANVVDLLDDLFHRAAEADEPVDMNFIRKHALELKGKGVDKPAARIFSNPAGDYGSMVNERVGAADWEDGSELGDTWKSRNAFSYGRGGERGTARPEVLSTLLGSTDMVCQEVDSVEYGLTDIQEYYANTGALVKAARTQRGGRKVSAKVVEAFGKDAKPRDLDATLRLEYRSKLLNPRWAEAMANQGSGGAFEISQRMTAMVGWSGTTDFKEQWVYDQAAQRYALDEEMAAKLKKNNPQAFQNVVKRMLEAAGRGFWKPDDKTVAKLRELYGEVEDELEGITLQK
eukprot:jgi/Mesvir1/26329/Mv22508-RA.1